MEANKQTPSNPWHYSYLSRKYFLTIRSACKKIGIWPVKNVYLGTTGEPYIETTKGRRIAPNWMVEDEKDDFYRLEKSRLIKGQYDLSKVQKIPYHEISECFKLDDAAIK